MSKRTPGPKEWLHLQAHEVVKNCEELLHQAEIKMDALAQDAFTEATGFAVGDVVVETDQYEPKKNTVWKLTGIDTRYTHEDISACWLLGVKQKKDGTFGKKPSTIFGCDRKNLKKVKP